MAGARKLPAKERDNLVATLQERFEENMHRHAGLSWGSVLKRIASNGKAPASLAAMEESGGEPDVVLMGGKPASLTFIGALFGDFRYGTVLIYHNGAESYYAARGFRCSLEV